MGKLSIVPEGVLPGIINQALLKVTLDNELMNNIFFVYVFSRPSFKMKYITSNRGSGIPNLPPMSVMKSIGFFSPPINLQNTFAERVQKIESQKEAMTNSLKELENNFNSLMQRVFKGEL